MATYTQVYLLDAPATVTLTLEEFNDIFLAFYDARQVMRERGYKVKPDQLKELEERIKAQINPAYDDAISAICAEYRANHPEQYPQEEVA